MKKRQLPTEQMTKAEMMGVAAISSDIARALAELSASASGRDYKPAEKLAHVVGYLI